jgi:MFS family permease
MKQDNTNKHVSDLLLILWAGGAALLSYSLVYALRKPYTAAAFEGLTFLGSDYKVAVTTIQILGYVISKFFGIKLISELKRENRFRFFVASAVMAEAALVGFGLLPMPYNVIAMFVNGLLLGCMWGVIFSFIEGRKVTDILASLLGVSMVFSSGFAKSFGLFAMNDLHIDQFWMPAVIGGCALPVLVFMGYMLKRLPRPTAEDVALRNERVTLDGKGRKALFIKYAPILTLLFVGNFMLLVLRDIKEDFLVNILDMSGQSSWMFARVDTIVTLVILGIFALFIFFRSNIKAIMGLMALVLAGCLTLTYVSFNYNTLDLQPVTWLFIISLSLYIAYLTFQTIFFDRFIACFRIKGNVGFFIAMIDFIGYIGTVTLLFTKESLNIETDWFALFNHMACFVGATCTVLFLVAAVLIYKRYMQGKHGRRKQEDANVYMELQYNTI